MQEEYVRRDAKHSGVREEDRRDRYRGCPAARRDTSEVEEEEAARAQDFRSMYKEHARSTKNKQPVDFPGLEERHAPYPSGLLEDDWNRPRVHPDSRIPSNVAAAQPYGAGHGFYRSPTRTGREAQNVEFVENLYQIPRRQKECPSPRRVPREFGNSRDAWLSHVHGERSRSAGG